MDLKGVNRKRKEIIHYRVKKKKKVRGTGQEEKVYSKLTLSAPVSVARVWVHGEV